MADTRGQCRSRNETPPEEAEALARGPKQQTSHQSEDDLNGINFRQLSLPEVLKEVGKDLLVQFCARFQSDLAKQNISLPPPDIPDHDYCNSLAALLKSPILLPDSFKDALFAIEDLATPEHSKLLKAAVGKAGNQTIITEGVCHERLALQLWLARPDLLLAFRRKKIQLITFKNFAGRLEGHGNGPVLMPEAALLDEMSARMHLWFLQRNPHAPRVRIGAYARKPGELWFLVHHGDTCRWIYNFQEEKAQLIHFRPEAEEALVCLAYEDQIWITAKNAEQREMYRQQFSLYLRGDVDYFSEQGEISLKVLEDEGADALDAAGLEGITAIKLCRDEVEGGGGRHERTITTGKDLFATAKGSRADTTFIAKGGILTRARFLIQFADSARGRLVEIRPPHKLKLERASDLRAVVGWMTKRGFMNLLSAAPASSKAA